MDDPALRPRIKKLLIECLALDGLEPDAISDDAALKDDLGLDSVDALELVLGLEKEFGVKLHGKGLDREAFRSVDSLAALVQMRLADAAREADGAPAH